MSRTLDERLMQRALDLAQLGKGNVSPNPMVGCVIVHQGLIIGEGYHQKYGGPHAEVNAIQSVEDQEKLTEATAYVSLEPCSHYGKTPPCADLLIAKKIKKVVVCNLDPNPLVAGRGLKKLEEAGIEVVTGVLEAQGKELNKTFFTAMTKKRPYVVLKWAQTQDGFIARENYDAKWISESLSRKWVHKWRAELEAIMVGTNTAHYDNPQLNVRSWIGNSPTRIVIDKRLRLSPKLHLFNQEISTICYNLVKTSTHPHLEFVQLSEDDHFISQLLTDLYQRKLHAVLVEGGTQLLQSFLAQGLWDEAWVFESTQKFEKGIAAPQLSASARYEQVMMRDRLKIYHHDSAKSLAPIVES